MKENELIAEIAKCKTYKELTLFLLKNCVDKFLPCDLCTHNIECMGEKCPNYESGIGGYLNDKWVNYSWSCKDFNFGECDKLINTPCYKCIEENFKNFKLIYQLD